MTPIERAEAVLFSTDISVADRVDDIMQSAQMRPSHRRHYRKHIERGVFEAIRDTTERIKAKAILEEST